ncbi:MAG TPA: GntR family transcriptional regulator [Candidatus Baltobacteraceae bacterium]|nr:GntR family transcriptional regulator [Candidatus Baltobacteraceae bacterium]
MSLLVRGTVDVLSERLREEILDGAFAPGVPIVQEEIAARFGVSRSPVREALRQLEAEGLIRYRPNRGAIVAALDPDAVRQTFELRRILETGAIALVVARIDAPALKEARSLDAALRRERDPAAFVKAHQRFHQHVYDVAANEPLARTIVAHSVRVARLPDWARTVREIMACSKADHAALLDALARRDARAARGATESHLAHVEAITLGALRRAPD